MERGAAGQAQLGGHANITLGHSEGTGNVQAELGVCVNTKRGPPRGLLKIVVEDISVCRWHLAAAGMTEEAVERMAEQYRDPAPSQVAPDLASDEWPDLNSSTANGHGKRQLQGFSSQHQV